MDTKCIENIARALADETRLRIFKAIAAKGSLTNGDLASLLAVTPATISHHLKILKRVELIECRKEGGWPTLDPLKHLGWPILAVLYHARVGLPFANLFCNFPFSYALLH